MSNYNDDAGKPPTHNLVALVRDPGSRERWVEVGAAWPNKKNGGFNIKLNPLVVIRGDVTPLLVLGPRLSSEPKKPRRGEGSDLPPMHLYKEDDFATGSLEDTDDEEGDDNDC